MPRLSRCNTLPVDPGQRFSNRRTARFFRPERLSVRPPWAITSTVPCCPVEEEAAVARIIRSPSAIARKQETRPSERREEEREERESRLRLKRAAYEREAETKEMPPVEDDRAA